MSLIEEIQNEAVDANTDVGSLLRKCKVFAARLGSEPLEQWLMWESNGYPQEVELPPYRVWPLFLKGNFAGPFGSSLSRADISTICLPSEFSDLFRRFRCRSSVSVIQQIVGKSQDTLTIPYPDLAGVVGDRMYTDMNCLQAWGEFDASVMVGVLNSVRNRILDFTLEVWKEHPGAGEIGATSSAPDERKIEQIFHTTVYGGSASLVGSASNSTITFNVEASNFDSLESALRENQVNEEDILELKVAIEAEPSPPSPTAFGPRVSAWISKMMQKAASGAWDVGVGAAGSLLAKAISAYYGLG